MRACRCLASLAVTLCTATVLAGCPGGPPDAEPPEAAEVPPETLPPETLPPETLPTEPWQALRQAIATLRRPIPPPAAADSEGRAQAARQLLARTVGWPDRRDYPAAGFVGYSRSRLHLVAGDLQAARQEAAAWAAEPEVAPEALFLLVEEAGLAGDAERRYRYERLLGRVLPLSVYGSLADRARTPRLGDDEAPVIPDLRADRLVEIAALFAELGWTEQAASAYREAIYGGYGPPWAAEERPGTWLSEEAIDLWLERARLQRAAGESGPAAVGVARALVHGAPRQREAAESLIADLEAGIEAEQELRAYDPDKVLEIARLYASMNVHPRAVALLRQHAAELPAGAAAVEQRLMAEWRQLLETYCAGASGPCVVFGYDVRSMERPEEIEIPRPAAPAALAELASEMESDPPRERE